MSELNLHRQSPSPSLQSYGGYRADHGESTLLKTARQLHMCLFLCTNQSDPADVKTASVGAFSFWALCGCRTWLMEIKHRLLYRLMCWVKAMAVGFHHRHILIVLGCNLIYLFNKRFNYYAAFVA